MYQAQTRTELGLPPFNPGKVDFIIRRTISKQIFEGRLYNKSETDRGVIIWSSADDSVPDTLKYLLGIHAPRINMIVPFRIQVFKEL